MLFQFFASHRTDLNSQSLPCDSDHPARDVPDVLLLRGEEAGVRPAVEERDAEALAGAHGNVHAELAGRLEHAQSHQVRGAHRQGLRENIVTFSERCMLSDFYSQDFLSRMRVGAFPRAIV